MLESRVSEMIGGCLAELRQKVPAWPPVVDVSEDDAMNIVRELIVKACFDHLDLGSFSAAQIQSARRSALREIDTHLFAWRDEARSALREKGQEREEADKVIVIL